MKVCYLGWSGPFQKELAHAVARAGHDVSFIAFFDSTIDPFYDPTGWSDVAVHTIPRRLKWRFPAAARHLHRILSRERPDILHAQFAFPYGLHAALAFRKGFVLSLHGSDANYDAWKMGSPSWQSLLDSGFGRMLFSWSHRFLAMRTERLVVGSPDLVERAAVLGYPASRVRLCELGVNVNFFRPGSAEPALRQRLLEPFPDGHVLLSTRGMNPIYAPLDLVHALARVVELFPDTILVMAGDRVQEGSVRREIAALRLEKHVKLVGLLPHEDVGRFMRASDVLCSVAYSDTSSLSVLEGMACGLPILATKVGSIPQRLSETRGGILVDPGDVDAIADGLVTLLSDPVARRQMGVRNAEFIARRLSFDTTVRCHLDVYQDMI